ncbi:DUF6121 family protein [Leifsonia poae]|uniref:DUF6121 family protein n=1 Tax=Leifsonia poae TaxID=110933 RepID=UPI001CBCA703|nr:hypothetical protein [Leifsonia poae]
MRDDRSYAAIVAVFAAFLYLAILVAAFGLISLATNTEVISDPAVGPLVGPVMCGAAVLTVFGFLLAIGTHVPAERQRISTIVALTVGFAAYIIFAAAGGVAGAAGDPAQPFHYFLFAFDQLGSWYSITAGIAGFVITLLYQLVLVGRFRQRGRPRWPWERDDE